jgi:hypothetical protein
VKASFFDRRTPAVLLAPVVLLMAAGVLMVRARAACSRGTAALSRRALDVAAVEFERAVGFYVPGDPVFWRSVEGLRAVAAGQERSGDLVGAWRTSERAQAAIRETASILPRDEGILRVLGTDQRRLEARLAASGMRVGGAAGPGVLPATPFKSALTVISLGVWLACTLVLASRLGGGRLPWRWAAASLAAWVSWAVTLWLV